MNSPSFVYLTFNPSEGSVLYYSDDVSLSEPNILGIREVILNVNSDSHNSIKRRCVDEIRRRLEVISLTRGRVLKKQAAIELFEFVIQHRWLIIHHPKFRETLHSKLVEFARDENFYLTKHFRILFPGQDLTKIVPLSQEE